MPDLPKDREPNKETLRRAMHPDFNLEINQSRKLKTMRKVEDQMMRRRTGAWTFHSRSCRGVTFIFVLGRSTRRAIAGISREQ